ncbi:hypothetical protein CU098_000677, partial [Rhizopus stolonifer]
MSTFDSSNAAYRFYLPREERKFWDIYYLHKHGVNLSGVKDTVELPKSTVHNIVKRIEETSSPLPKKQSEASKKIDERASRHLQR